MDDEDARRANAFLAAGIGEDAEYDTQASDAATAQEEMLAELWVEHMERMRQLYPEAHERRAGVKGG